MHRLKFDTPATRNVLLSSFLFVFSLPSLFLPVFFFRLFVLFWFLFFLQYLCHFTVFLCPLCVSCRVVYSDCCSAVKSDYLQSSAVNLHWVGHSWVLMAKAPFCSAYCIIHPLTNLANLSNATVHSCRLKVYTLPYGRSDCFYPVCGAWTRFSFVFAHALYADFCRGARATRAELRIEKGNSDTSADTWLFGYETCQDMLGDLQP